jgi:hypothetical protein
MARTLASVMACDTATPALEATAVSVTPLVKYPNRPYSGAAWMALQARRACSSGVMAAVSRSNPSTAGTGAGGDRPGKLLSRGALSAASAARRAACRKPSSSVRFVNEIPMRPSRTTRSVTDSSSISVGWCTSDPAKRASPDRSQ